MARTKEEKARDKHRARNAKHYRAHRDRLNANARAHYVKNRATLKEYFRMYHFKSKYGLTPDQYEALLSAHPACAICGRPFSGSLRPYVDHDHTTNKVRAPLCSVHNVGLGFFQENPIFLANAIAYLAFHKEVSKAA